MTSYGITEKYCTIWLYIWYPHKIGKAKKTVSD